MPRAARASAQSSSGLRDGVQRGEPPPPSALPSASSRCPERRRAAAVPAVRVSPGLRRAVWWAALAVAIAAILGGHHPVSLEAHREPLAATRSRPRRRGPRRPRRSCRSFWRLRLRPPTRCRRHSFRKRFGGASRSRSASSRRRCARVRRQDVRGPRARPSRRSQPARSSAQLTELSPLPLPTLPPLPELTAAPTSVPIVAERAAPIAAAVPTRAALAEGTLITLDEAACRRGSPRSSSRPTRRWHSGRGSAAASGSRPRVLVSEHGAPLQIEVVRGAREGSPRPPWPRCAGGPSSPRGGGLAMRTWMVIPIPFEP